MHEHGRITAVCFDLGGVLARLAGSWAEALRWAGFPEVAQPRHDVRVHSWEPYNVHELGLTTDEVYFEALREFLGLDSAREALQAHLWVLGEPYAGTLELVTDVQRAGIRTGCLSNTEHLHWERMVGGFYPAIKAIEVKGGSHLLRARKPDHAIFEAFEKLSGFDRESTLFFDDSPGHVEGALAFGWQAVRLDPTGDTAAQMRSAMARLGMEL